VSILNGDDLIAFRQHWQKALPVLVSRPDVWYRADIWRPSALARCPGSPALDVKNGLDIPAGQYWDQFERLSKCPVVSSSSVCAKDWPSPDDLLAFSTHLRDLDAGLPFPEYTRFGGALHSMSHLPEYFVRPELSTLRILGHGSSVSGHVTACSKLRMDSADTVNTTVFVSGELEDYELQDPNIVAALGDPTQVAKLIHSCTKNVSKPVSAVWHVFRPQDADVIRDFMVKVAGTGHQDALSETNSYLDASLRTRLANDHSVNCSTVVQCLGDTIFIPAMAPYQVCAIQNCIIASREFLSPESLRYCHDAGNSRRNRNSKNGPASNFEDQLQGKNLIYHTVKDAIAVLKSADP
jgi:lysine-specific demethylase 3